MKTQKTTYNKAMIESKEDTKIKICFILPSLGAGGAERVMSFIAENIDSNHFDSQLLVIGSEKEKSYEIVNIPVTFLGKSRVKHGVSGIIKFVHKNRPEIVVSAISHLNTVMAIISILFPKVRFVGRETIVKSAIAKLNNLPAKPSGITNWKNKIQALNLDAIICQSEDMRYDLQENYGFPPEKLVVLNNPITHNFRLKNKKTANTVLQFITIGRLVEQKGHLRILNALANYKSPFHYTIIGDGDQKERIFTLIKEKGLEGQVTHIPFTSEIQTYLENSDLFLQGSHVEGFPNALLETCTVGTPAVVFDAPGGINEIIIEGLNGFIAMDEQDFLKKIEISSLKDWSPLKINNSVISRYSEEIILKKYENFFLQLYRANQNNHERLSETFEL